LRASFCLCLLIFTSVPAMAGSHTGMTTPGMSNPVAGHATVPDASSPAPVATLPVVFQASSDAATELPGVAVSSIVVTGADNIAPGDIDAAVSTFVGHRLSVDDMEDLLATVSGLARAKGYIFAHSSAPAQKLESGVLHIDLDEGHIDEIRLIGAKNAAVQSIINGLKGHAPLRSELDRRLMLAQDIPGVRIGDVKFERENGRGILIVPLTNQRIAGKASLDNWGTRGLGPVRAQLAYDFNGLLDDRDQLAVSYLGTPAQSSELAAASMRYSHLVGDHGTELAVYGAYGRSNEGGRWRTYNANGDWLSTGISLAQPLVRERNVSFWINGSIDYISVNQWFSNEMVRRDRVTTASLSLNGYVPLAGGRLRAGVGLVHGLDVLGATTGNDPLASRPDADGHFTIYNAWSNWTGDLVGPFSAKLAVTAQLASSPLLVAEQISIGGPVFGRAYDFSERTGDRGILGSAELQAKIWDRSRGLVRWVQLYGFADAGDVTDLRNAYGTGALYSAGLGARAGLPHALRLGVEAAFPLNADRFETGTNAPRISATASASF